MNKQPSNGKGLWAEFSSALYKPRRSVRDLTLRVNLDKSLYGNPLAFRAEEVQIFNFTLSQGLGRFFQLSYPQLACLSCTTLARNSPVALAIAASAFPHRPLISVALVVGPLMELPILALVSQILLKQQDKA